MNRPWIGAVLGLVLLAAGAWAQDVSVSTRAWPARAKLGDEIRLLIHATAPPGFDVRPPSPKQSLEPFEIKNVEERKTRKGELFALTLTAFELGELTIPSIPLVYTDARGRSGQVVTQPQKVRIESVGRKPTDSKDIRPIKGPASMSLRALVTAALAACAAILAGILAMLIYNRLKKKRIEDLESLKPPHERAILELGRLHQRGYLHEKKPKEHYGELADILRRYLDRRFGLDSMEWTTHETAAVLKERPFDGLSAAKVREILEACDLVKFAKAQPPNSLAESLKTGILGLIEATKPLPEAGPKK
ncbi:MAG: hypothetical protein A3D28_02535 [Omnitrophica bacterium RIFCSPHIGHO2_02_FULL_63_14]|nr:MAG: hypothetical protein A3D28_02535 [Omnitrophica bacterium RIFCSPHIGHO2_02_FULL_63_14]